MNKIFFLDIFNKIIKIGDKEIFIIFDIKGEIWFSFKSLVSSLEYSSYNKQLSKLNITPTEKKNETKNHSFQ